MGRMYTVPMDAVAATAIQDLFAIQAATGKPIALHEVAIAQSSDTDSEQLRIRIRRAASGYTPGSGGSAPTPAPLNSNDAAAGATARINDTTQATGTITTLKADAFNVLSGWHYIPTPECRPVAQPGQAFIVDLPAAPADSLTLSGYLVFEEIA